MRSVRVSHRGRYPRPTSRCTAPTEQSKQASEKLNGHLRAKAESFSTTMHAAAEGDFTQRMDPESRTEAMTESRRRSTT